MKHRFNDSITQVSAAATIFDVASAEMPQSEQLEKLRLLCDYFKLNSSSVEHEWLCFRQYLVLQKEKTCPDIMNSLLQSDLADAFPLLATIAGIVLACPIGTAGRLWTYIISTLRCNLCKFY